MVVPDSSQRCMVMGHAAIGKSWHTLNSDYILEAFLPEGHLMPWH